MSNKHDINYNEPKEDAVEEDDVSKSYNKLNEKCDIIISKIKKRKKLNKAANG